jgi:hypothetical protein
MAADLHNTITFYGYKIILPVGYNYREYIETLYGLNSILDADFQIGGILSSFHTCMENASYDELECFDDNAVIIIGFHPNDNLETTLKMGVKLAEYIVDNPILEGIEISIEAKFYSGIDWFNTIINSDDMDDSDDTDDTDDTDGTDDEEDEDDSNEDEDGRDNYEYDDNSSDENEYKITPELLNK